MEYESTRSFHFFLSPKKKKKKKKKGLLELGSSGKNGNFPTIVPGVEDGLFSLPMPPTAVGNLKRGQVVAFIRLQKPMLNTTPKSCRFVQTSIQRIAALEGEVVEYNGKEYTVPKDYFWALGDNPEESIDSRHFGAVPLQNVRAIVLFAYSFRPLRFRSVTEYKVE